MQVCPTLYKLSPCPTLTSLFRQINRENLSIIYDAAIFLLHTYTDVFYQLFARKISFLFVTYLIIIYTTFIFYKVLFNIQHSVSLEFDFCILS